MFPCIAESAIIEALVKQERKNKIYQLEDAMRKLPQVEFPVDHTYGPGFYARTINIKAGTTLTGKIHATEHIFFVSKGEILLYTEDGEMHVKAPFQCISRPGMKRVGHAITDVICTNIHITDEKDLEKLEAQLIIPDGLPSPDKKEVLQ